MLKTNSRLQNTPNNFIKLDARKASSFVLCIMGLFLMSLVGSCGSDNGTTDEDGYNREAMLQSYSNWLQTEYTELEIQLSALQTAHNAFETDPIEANLLPLQEAFKLAYLQWQRVDFMTEGNAMDVFLVESANTFPVNTDLVEKNILDGVTNLDPINQLAAQGFPAMDYILYGTNLDYLKDPKTRTYLRTVINRIADKSKSTVDGWQSSEEAFIKDSGSDAGGSISTIFNAFVQSFERRTRDAKVGIPAGIRTDNVIQPEQVEALYSQENKDLLLANLRAMKDFFNGYNETDQEGFDDYLDFLKSQKGEISLSEAINQQFDAIITKAESLQGPIDKSIENDKLEAIALFNEMQKIVVLFKVDMASELGIFINYADNDGDS